MLIFLVCVSIILHALDVHTTLSAGGLAVEGNPIAIFVWSRWGIAPLILVKVLSIALLVIAWRFYEAVPFRRLFRLVLGAGFVGNLALNLALNLSVMRIL